MEATRPPGNFVGFAYLKHMIGKRCLGNCKYLLGVWTEAFCADRQTKDYLMTTQQLHDCLASTLRFDSTTTPTPDYPMKRTVTPKSSQSDRNQQDPHGNHRNQNKMRRIRKKPVINIHNSLINARKTHVSTKSIQNHPNNVIL